MRVLLLGASGHLGSHLADRLADGFSVAVAPRVDVEDVRALEGLLDDGAPEVIVNAIGAAPTAAHRVLDAVNAEFPRRLAALAVARRARVVHISTDGVFSGRRGEYAERDAPDPADAYGRSKLAGELAAPHLTIRTTFFGRNHRGTGLVEWIAASRASRIDGFADYRFSGIAAALAADLVVAAIEARLEGVYHVGGEPISKYELVRSIAALLRPDLAVVPVERGAVDRTLESSRFFSAVGRVRPALADSLQNLGVGADPCACPERSSFDRLRTSGRRVGPGRTRGSAPTTPPR